MCCSIFHVFHVSFFHSLAGIQRSFNIDISTRTVLIFASRRMRLIVSQFHRVKDLHRRCKACHALACVSSAWVMLLCCIACAAFQNFFFFFNHVVCLSFEGVPATFFCWRTTPPVGPTFPAAPGTLKTVHGRESSCLDQALSLSAVNLLRRELRPGRGSWMVNLLCCVGCMMFFKIVSNLYY